MPMTAPAGIGGNIGLSGGINGGTGGQAMGMALLVILGGLTVLYVWTRGMQGIRGG